MIDLTQNAADKIKDLLTQESIPAKGGLRVFVKDGCCSGYSYGMTLADAADAEDLVEESQGIRVMIDPQSLPLLQGARLTTWECKNYGIPVTLICDNAAATVVRQGKVNCAIVGADRIASNGDTANKIGTYNLALICNAHNVPFYVAAPYSTFDFSLK